VPHPIGPDKATYALMRALHEWAFDGLFVLGLVHIGAALLHQFVWRDGLMRRMWFRGAGSGAA
jgi:cytochrome b561